MSVLRGPVGVANMLTEVREGSGRVTAAAVDQQRHGAGAHIDERSTALPDRDCGDLRVGHHDHAHASPQPQVMCWAVPVARAAMTASRRA